MMSVTDAKRIASIFEADDIISIPAMASRVLLNRVIELESQVQELEQSTQRSVSND